VLASAVAAKAVAAQAVAGKAAWVENWMMEKCPQAAATAAQLAAGCCPARLLAKLRDTEDSKTSLCPIRLYFSEDDNFDQVWDSGQLSVQQACV